MKRSLLSPSPQRRTDLDLVCGAVDWGGRRTSEPGQGDGILSEVGKGVDSAVWFVGWRLWGRGAHFSHRDDRGQCSCKLEQAAAPRREGYLEHLCCRDTARGPGGGGAGWQRVYTSEMQRQKGLGRAGLQSS